MLNLFLMCNVTIVKMLNLQKKVNIDAIKSKLRNNQLQCLTSMFTSVINLQHKN